MTPRPPSSVQVHLRNTMLAGALAAVPLAVTVFILWWVEDQSEQISLLLFGRRIPLVGILIAVAIIYVSGLIATSLIGRALLRLLDRVLGRIPLLSQAYVAWKHIALTPGGTEGTFSKVCLIPDEAGQTLLLGFTSGRPLDGDPNALCVLVPNAPNPLQGRLYFVRADRCQTVDVSTEEAFKVILSTGNYVPAAMGDATSARFPPPESRQILPADFHGCLVRPRHFRVACCDQRWNEFHIGRSYISERIIREGDRHVQPHPFHRRRCHRDRSAQRRMPDRAQDRGRAHYAPRAGRHNAGVAAAGGPDAQARS